MGGAFSVGFKKTEIVGQVGEKQREKGSALSTLLVVRDKILADRKVVISLLFEQEKIELK